MLQRPNLLLVVEVIRAPSDGHVLALEGDVRLQQDLVHREGAEAVRSAVGCLARKLELVVALAQGPQLELVSAKKVHESVRLCSAKILDSVQQPQTDVLVLHREIDPPQPVELGPDVERTLTRLLDQQSHESINPILAKDVHLLETFPHALPPRVLQLRPDQTPSIRLRALKDERGLLLECPCHQDAPEDLVSILACDCDSRRQVDVVSDGTVVRNAIQLEVGHTAARPAVAAQPVPQNRKLRDGTRVVEEPHSDPALAEAGFGKVQESRERRGGVDPSRPQEIDPTLSARQCGSHVKDLRSPLLDEIKEGGLPANGHGSWPKAAFVKGFLRKGHLQGDVPVRSILHVHREWRVVERPLRDGTENPNPDCGIHNHPRAINDRHFEK
mmetsp:Transcript_3741/g.14671  ORF Transcript_3741/g.14671 Transcript_3741/m.14671 type:complete len:386 (-) Transcript_3741:576-1733(-)